MKFHINSSYTRFGEIYTIQSFHEQSIHCSFLFPFFCLLFFVFTTFIDTARYQITRDRARTYCRSNWIFSERDAFLIKVSHNPDTWKLFYSGKIHLRIYLMAEKFDITHTANDNGVSIGIARHNGWIIFVLCTWYSHQRRRLLSTYWSFASGKLHSGHIGSSTLFHCTSRIDGRHNRNVYSSSESLVANHYVYIAFDHER